MLTAKDDQTPPGTSEATMVTITVNDLNEAPSVDEELDDVTNGVAGTDIVIDRIHLEDLFSDQDDTDSIFTYELDVTMVSGNGEMELKLTTETVTYTATAPTVANSEYEYEPPMEEEDDGMGNGMNGNGNGNGNGMEEEEEPTATVIGAVTFTDPDTGAAMDRGDEHTIEVVGNDNFEIHDDGNLVLKAGLVLEEDTTVMVSVTDRYGLTGTGTITITIAMEEEEGMEDGMGMEDGNMDGEGDGMEEEAPDPETKEVTFITGMVTGTPTAGTYGEWNVAVVATDDSGASRQGRVQRGRRRRQRCAHRRQPGQQRRHRQRSLPGGG